jgi:WD40 repeat protein
MFGISLAQNPTSLRPSLDILITLISLHGPPLLLSSQHLLINQSSSGKLELSQQSWLGLIQSLYPLHQSQLSITLRARDGIFITSDSDGVVRICDILTGLCKSSFQTPAKGAVERDIGMFHGRLILAWHTDGEIKIWDVEKEELLLTVDGPGNLHDIKISEDGSRVFSIGQG